MNTARMLEGMVSSAANNAAAYYSFRECSDCGGALSGTGSEECVNEQCGGGAFNPMDVEYTISGDGKVKGVVLTITTGGPHIEVTCRYGQDISAQGWWNGDRTHWRGKDRGDEVVDTFKEYLPFLIQK